MTHASFHSGPIGALTDEYARALDELKSLLGGISHEQFSRIADPDSDYAEMRSIQGVLSHVIGAGYLYANYIRKRFNEREEEHSVSVASIADARSQLDLMFRYTLATLANKHQLTDEELLHTLIKTSWTIYDLESLLEHAIVHVLRHRRQIQKFLNQETSQS